MPRARRSASCRTHSTHAEKPGYKLVVETNRASMLFNSIEFIFVFLPIALTIHFLAAGRGIRAAAIATTLASLFFYGWWEPSFLPLPVLSIALNFLLARLITRSEGDRKRWLLILGITANLLVLVYFKYS